MPQPVWITPAGSLGTIPENIFYQVTVEADGQGQDVFFRMIAGELPDGIQVTRNGIVEGTPKTRVQGTPTEVGRDVTSRFAIRAYTTKVVNGVIVVDRLADRTFEITVTGQDVPEFVTPAGLVASFYDGTEGRVEIEFTDTDPDQQVRVRLFNGQLPPGMVLDPVTGIIAGVIVPLTGPGGTAQAGYDRTQYDQFPYDFTTRSSSRSFQFTLEVTDGVDSNFRTFVIAVYSRDSMTADTTDFTADNTFITADVSPVRTPILLTPPGDLGRVRADNFYAFKFDGTDFDGDPIEYSITVGAGIGFDATGSGYDEFPFDRGAFSLPPGLTINPDTGWFYGYIPDQGATEQTYRFAIQVRKKNNPTVISDFYYFTITIIGQIDTEVTWLTAPDLGTVLNGSISTLYVAATNRGGRILQYRMQSGSDSRLPQGLTLQPTGHITGRVSFNTFALDGGTTTFDVNSRTREGIGETTFDQSFSFTVNAFSSETEQLGLEVSSFVITNAGSGYSSQPTVTISAPPATVNAIQATAGAVSFGPGGVITSIALGNPGRGYLTPPTVIITGGGGTGATAVASMIESDLTNAVSVFRRFTVRVDRYFNAPYQSLYVKCMPPYEDRALITDLVQNQDIIPVELVYRADDPNFGVAQNVTYVHAYGLNAASFDDYVSSLVINHYWKNITLGEIRTAQALDATGAVLYDVVYSEIIDDLVNNSGESVSKQVTLPFPVTLDDDTEVDTVYPNSLINMRDQVVDTVGQISPPLTPALPLWMTSKQADGSVLGFTPAWVIAYVNPGQGGRVAYNIRTQFTQALNSVDFKVDRYEIDRSMTWQWDVDVSDVVLAVTSITGDPLSQVVTVNFVPQPTAPFATNDRIQIQGTSNSRFNGWFNVDTCGLSQLTFRAATAGSSTGGRALGRPAWQEQTPAATTFDQVQQSSTVVTWFNNSGPIVTWRNNSGRIISWVTPPSGIGQEGTIFDGNSTRFITPTVRWVATDSFDKYLVFPRINILQ